MSVSDKSFDKALNKITGLSRQKRDLLDTVRAIKRVNGTSDSEQKIATLCDKAIRKAKGE